MLYADGGVRVVDASINPETIKILISCNGGEIFAINAVCTRPIAGTNSASGFKVLRIRGADGQARASIQ